MSKLRTNIIENQSGSTITIGKSGTNVALAAGATQTGFGGDLTPLQNDMSVLALHQAINSNQTAHGLQNSWIEQFEDSNSITDLTDCSRSDSEYMASIVAGNPADWPYTNANTQTIADGGNNMSGVPSSTDHTKIKTTSSGYLGYWMTTFTYSTTWMYVDYLAQYTWPSLKVSFSGQHSQVWYWRLEHSNDGTNWTVMNQTGTTTAAWTGQSFTTENVVTGIDTSTGVFTNSNPGPSGATGGVILTFGTAVTARYLRLGVGNIHTNYNDPTAGLQAFIPSYQPLQINATGSFTSTAITPQDGTSKSSLGLVLLYKDNAGTNALNTDIVAQVSADNGVNYTNCVLASRGTFSTGIKTAIAPAVDVTSGNQLKYKINFANQASGSKEAQVYGVSLQY